MMPSALAGPARGGNIVPDVHAKLRRALFAFGVVLGLCGTWMLLPALVGPKPAGLPLDLNGAEAVAAFRSRAVLAARVSAVRGDLWAEAAFTGAHFMWIDRSANLDPANSKELASVRANAETALSLAPVNGAAWLFLAMLPQSSPDRDSRVPAFLEMSYFTAPNDLSLAPLRVIRAATSSALANKDIQVFIKGDIRGLLDLGPDYQQDIIAAYRSAWPQNQPIFEALVAEIDPGMAELLRSGQAK
ncbi:MAG: hypothetical protein L0Y60_12420 [Beijerinckiaceae bacterium]|nr:hypothetical protein [Beijerinckiaceae bacterium]